MLRLTIKKNTIKYIKDYFIRKPGIVLEDDTLLIENSILDSTGVIELVAFLETNFQISIEDDEIVPENLNSINMLADFVQSKIAKRTRS